MSASQSGIDDAVVPVRPIVALSVGACGSAAALRVCDPLLPRIAADYGVGLAAASQTVTAFAVAYGVLQLAYGPIGDRYGKYRVVTIATLSCSITSLACSLAPSFEVLVLARMLAGATAGGLIPLSIAWIGDAVPYGRRQPVLARFLIGNMFGVALGQLLGGLGADRFGAQYSFLALAIWFVATAWVLWRFAPRQTATAQARRRDSIIAQFRSVLSGHWPRVVLATVFVEGLFVFGALAFIPTHVHRAYALNMTAASALVMLYAVGGLVFATLAGLFVRRLGEAGLVVWGGVLLMLSLITIAFGHWLVIVTFSCLLAGLGFYMFHNTLQVNATQMAPDQRGSSLALFVALLFVGQAAGVSIAGVAAERLGTAPVISGAGVAVLMLGVLFAAARRRRVLQSA